MDTYKNPCIFSKDIVPSHTHTQTYTHIQTHTHRHTHTHTHTHKHKHTQRRKLGVPPSHSGPTILCLVGADTETKTGAHSCIPNRPTHTQLLHPHHFLDTPSQTLTHTHKHTQTKKMEMIRTFKTLATDLFALPFTKMFI